MMHGHNIYGRGSHKIYSRGENRHKQIALVQIAMKSNLEQSIGKYRKLQHRGGTTQWINVISKQSPNTNGLALHRGHPAHVCNHFP